MKKAIKGHSKQQKRPPKDKDKVVDKWTKEYDVNGTKGTFVITILRTVAGFNKIKYEAKRNEPKG